MVDNTDVKIGKLEEAQRLCKEDTQKQIALLWESNQRLKKLIFGNGDEGIKDKIAVLLKEIKGFSSDHIKLESLEDEILKLQSRHERIEDFIGKTERTLNYFWVKLVGLLFALILSMFGLFYFLIKTLTEHQIQ